MKFSDIRICLDDYDHLVKEAGDNYNVNSACTLSGYWSERMNKQIGAGLKEFGGRLVYGFVGDGWPIISDQSKVIPFDKLNLFSIFDPYDRNCRDVGDAVYQANLLVSYANLTDQSVVYDFGSGYGRLAVPILKACSCIYLGVDYVPESLLIAPQFVSQMLGYNRFVSVPTWKLGSVCRKGNLFISVHSFQEMTKEAIAYFVSFMERTGETGSLFYSINLWPEEKYVPDSWELLFDRPFPFNRDGSYNERLWRIK